MPADRSIDDLPDNCRGARGRRVTVLGSGLLCVTMFAIGFGFFLHPISIWLGDLANFGGIVSGMVCLGLLEGE